MKIGKWVLAIAGLALIFGGVASAQIQANRLCIHNGGDYYIIGFDHDLPNNGGGKYYPTYLHKPAMSLPWTLPGNYTWKVAGWCFTGMQAQDFSTTWVWKTCLQYSIDNPYATTMTFVWPYMYCTGAIPHTGSYSVVYGGIIPTATPIVGGLGYVYPSSMGSMSPYLNVFLVASAVFNISGTAPFYGWSFAWSGPCSGAVTVPSAYSIYQFSWENMGPKNQYLILSGNEMDCTTANGGNKGKNYTIGSIFDAGYYYYWPNNCNGTDSEWAGCLFVCDTVTIPTNVPGTSHGATPFLTYGFDVGSGTVTPLASSGLAKLQLMTEDYNKIGTRVLLAGWRVSGGGLPYGASGYRLPHAWDIFTDFFASIIAVWGHVTLPGYPACQFGTTGGGHSIPVPIPPLPQLMCLELIYCGFSGSGFEPSAGYMVCYF
jgi:hypothetical protein